MERRNFLSALAGASFSSAVHPRIADAQGRTKLPIRSVKMWRLEGKYQAVAGINRQHQVRPLHMYSEHRPETYHETGDERTETRTKTALYLEIKTDLGLTGVYGPIDREAAVVVDRQLKDFLVGKDALAIETLWDQMHRSNRHSRAGHFMMGISAVDNALWDLRGRYFNVPVYRLLGGPTRKEAEVYGSCLGFSVEPEPARRLSAEFKHQGFRHQKWFLAYGPGDGPAGLKKNVELVRNLRESVGGAVDLMFDAFMGWDFNYALRWVKQVEPYRPRWIEEAFHADKMNSFAELRKQTSIPVATGEHFYGRWEVQRFLNAGAIDVVQADPEWCGGVSELVKICTIASAYDVHVIPHGHNLHAALHVVSSQSPMTCPLVEYLINKMKTYYHFEKHQLKPVNGKIVLPDRPGFGIEFDEQKIEKQSRARWS